MKKSKEELVHLAKDLWEIGVKKGFRVIRWTKDGNVDYDWAREISNSRFDLQPVAIAFPRTAEQVARCVTFCVESGVPFRVRSGGHQHEGMSSLDDGVVIRLSELSAIQYEGEDHAWIGVGKPLKEIYDELQLRCMTIPGGGCWSVNVGGLALGGGWGTSVRKMGLTCDNFEAVEMVTADGEVICVRKDGEEYRDLFWALRGGGGGNFGIVTRFLFRLHEIGPHVNTFSMEWKEGTEEHLTDIVRGYLEEQTKFPLELTTAMGLRVKHRFMKEGQYFPLGISGKFYGSLEDLRSILKPFICKYEPDKRSDNLKSIACEQTGEVQSLAVEENVFEFGQGLLLSDLITELVDFLHLGAPGDSEEKEGEAATTEAEYAQKAPPGTTCLAAWPHKISSGFPKGRHVYENLARKAVRILLRTNKNLPDNAARLYMVLHSMPGDKGNIKPWESAFFWRDKEFILQFQAWWAKPCLAEGDEQGKRAYERDAKRYLCWIRNSRKQLDPELEGAFINFVDRDLPVETYYGGNYARLREIKKRYDRNNVFHFPLSIPPAEDPWNDETRLTSQGFDVVTQDDTTYETSRRISNALFDLKPRAIAYPWTAEQVALCVRYCREHRLPLRVRSGGHQHEGMCSADDALMVRLSEMKCIEYVSGKDQAWIGVGARLEDVYGELQKRRKTIAGGGCKSVNVGGLTLGGGWGLSARKFGLASDNVLALEVVLADGRIVQATRKNQYSNLFWALLGSGGGNFGIVTRFLFQLHEIEPNLSKYKLYWKGKESREAIIKKWLAFQRTSQSTDTTSYLVLYADLEGANGKPRFSVYAGGASYSPLDALEAEVDNLTDGLPEADKSDFKALFPAKDLIEGADALKSAASFAAIGDFFSYAEDPPGLFDSSLALEFNASEELGSDCRVAFPKDNCLGSFPHKVTSAFPKPDSDNGSLEEYEARLAAALSRFLQEHPVNPYVKSYISLYSMGGAVAEIPREKSAFWYRRKSFVLQIESWWSYPDPKPGNPDCRDQRAWQQPYIHWVRSFRDTLRDEGLIEGAFINFIDRDLEESHGSVEDRKRLLRHYYGDNLERLMESKEKWDPEDFFHFEMSVPLPEKK